ncbi:MAG: 1-deoxy-D-xylulose-5-phosphate reductoisomerase [Chloroflexota bacterium]
MAQKIVILGSTGSIGRQTLQVVAAQPDQFEVLALAAGRNTCLLTEQVREFHPRFVGADVDPAELACQLDLGKLGAEPASLVEMATLPDAELVVVATTGKAGLEPSLAALRAGKTLCLANKEVLVMAGELVLQAHRRYGGQVRPIDSEHSALWQCLVGERASAPNADTADDLVGLPEALATVERLVLTASGGAFRDLSAAELRQAPAELALRHPNWTMGPRVTIDSATLVNKGLEVIEAHWLFGMPYERLDVVVHRESIVHSLVEFKDGAMKAQLGAPDMRLPIQYALSYPSRWPGPWPRLDLAGLRQLTFAPVDHDRFPALRLAVEAGRRGGTYPAVLAASDETAVGLYLAGRITFPDIARLIDGALQAHNDQGSTTLELILEADAWARRKCLELAGA